MKPQPHSSSTTEQTLRDRFSRPIHDLRISVIDRCNFRCTYCMPQEESGHYKFLDPGNWLSFEEIERLVRLFVACGVSKVRLTGGEPLVRPNLAQLVSRLCPIKGIDDLALTTNGSLLSRHADELKKAGLKRLTVSLDTLDPLVFKEMGGKKADLAEVMEGLAAAEKAGFEKIKINVVVKKGVKDHTLMNLVRHFKGSGHILRFIEFMDVGNCNHWSTEYVLPSAQIMKMINEYYPLEPVKANYEGEVANRYRYVDGGGEIGFISSVTQPFCGNCSRLRLSTDGKIYTCLFATEGTDLRGPMRAGANDQDLRGIIENTWKRRDDRYSENRILIKSHPENERKKIEMFQIGG